MPTELQHQAMGYDRSATMFSPDGHLLQVEYAEKMVNLGSASIGMTCKDGVLIIADKRVRDKLIAAESATKILEVDEHIIATAAGMLSDTRILIDYAQVLAQQNRVTYDSPIEPVSIIRAIADKKQLFTQYGGARPFAVSMMVAGISKERKHLYTSDVSGNFSAFKANSIGEHEEKIKEMLRTEYKEEMGVDEGFRLCMKIFKKILDKNFDLSRFEASYVPLDKQKLIRLQGEELKKYVK